MNRPTLILWSGWEKNGEFLFFGNQELLFQVPHSVSETRDQGLVPALLCWPRCQQESGGVFEGFWMFLMWWPRYIWMSQKVEVEGKLSICTSCICSSSRKHKLWERSCPKLNKSWGSGAILGGPKKLVQVVIIIPTPWRRGFGNGYKSYQIIYITEIGKQWFVKNHRPWFFDAEHHIKGFPSPWGLPPKNRSRRKHVDAAEVRRQKLETEVREARPLIKEIPNKPGIYI